MTVVYKSNASILFINNNEGSIFLAIQLYLVSFSCMKESFITCVNLFKYHFYFYYCYSFVLLTTLPPFYRFEMHIMMILVLFHKSIQIHNDTFIVITPPCDEKKCILTK
jgi:hypothetical protein